MTGAKFLGKAARRFGNDLKGAGGGEEGFAVSLEGVEVHASDEFLGVDGVVADVVEGVAGGFRKHRAPFFLRKDGRGP